MGIVYVYVKTYIYALFNSANYFLNSNLSTMKQKFFTLFFLASIISSPSFTQAVIKNQKTAGGNSVDDFTSMSLTSDGGFIAAGFSYSDSSFEKTENSREASNGDNSFDYWVVKFDKQRNIQWNKTIGGRKDDVCNAVQQTTDGGYIVGGYSSSGANFDKTTTNRGFNDYWIVKLDAQGNIQWDKTIGGSSEDQLSALQQTTDGGYILGGWSGSGISGEKSANSKGNQDYWVVKTDSSGNVQWDKTIGGSNFDYLNAVRQTTDGGYILGGRSLSNQSSDKTENSRGAEDYWVVKLNSNGNIEWDRTIGGTANDVLYALEQTKDNGYMLGGSSGSDISGEKTQNNWNAKNGYADYWVVKLNSSGSIQWGKTIGGTRADNLRSLQQTSDKGYILGGYSTSGISGDKTEKVKDTSHLASYLTNDYWVVKLDSAGNKQWDKTIGGNSEDQLRCIKEVKPNSYLLGGASSSPVSFDKSEFNRYSLDYWIVRLDYQAPVSKTSVKENISVTFITGKNNDFTAYPNPAKSMLYIRINNAAVISLNNAEGKTILQKTINRSGTIDVSKFSAGIYYIKNSATGLVREVMVVR
ncbi:hypothetical protein BH10BAC2_BH10BAC2_43440 [soil metagenome]